MSGSSSRSQAGALVFLGLFIFLLMLFISWSFRADNMFAGSFRLEDIQICEDLDEDMKPLNVVRSVPDDTKQICLWFSYSRAREGDSLEITWNFGNQTIQKDVLRVARPNGVRAFYLLKEDGSSLPAGQYSVAICCNGREKLVEFFSVMPESDDIAENQDEFFDGY